MMNSGKKDKRLTLKLRDLEILQALYATRYMTTPQIQALFWRASTGGQFGTLKASQRRLRQLNKQGLVRRIEPMVSYGESRKPLIYALDKVGAQILTEELGIDPADIDWKPKSAERNYPFLQHILDTTDIRIAITQACDQGNVQLETWLNDQELKREDMLDEVTLLSPAGNKYKASVIPDAVFLLRRDTRVGLFFLEIDRRTVTVDPSKWERRGWSRKVRTFVKYFETEAFHNRYGDRIARVLTVTIGDKRLAHMKETTEQSGGDSRFWFTTLDQAMNPSQLLTEAIWTRAGIDGLYALLR
jgi:hypothetical protein